MGARLITFDLTSGFNITEEAAEAMKIAYAAKAEVNDAEHVAAYVNSRAGEIAANVLAQLNTAGYNAQTLNKIVLTGGGSHIPAFAAQLTAQGKMPTRFAEMPRDIAFRVAGRNTPTISTSSRSSWQVCVKSKKAARHHSPPGSPVTVFEEEQKPDAAEPEQVDDEPEARVENVQENVTEIYTPGTGGRRVVNENDPDIFDDDPDEEIRAEERPKRTFSIFGRRKKSSRGPNTTSAATVSRYTTTPRAKTPSEHRRKTLTKNTKTTTATAQSVPAMP